MTQHKQKQLKTNLLLAIMGLGLSLPSTFQRGTRDREP